MAQNVLKYPNLIPGAHYAIILGTTEIHGIFEKETDEYIQFIVNTLEDPFRLSKKNITYHYQNSNPLPSSKREGKTYSRLEYKLQIKNAMWINIYSKPKIIDRVSV